MSPPTGVKKSTKTTYGKVDIATSEPFSQHPNGFGISPYLQEKVVFVGQCEVYTRAAELLEQLLGLSVHPSQIYRMTTHYGAAIEADLDQPVELPATAVAEGDEPESDSVANPVVYVQADGAMLLTDEGYKENKLARIFRADALRDSTVEGRGGHIEQSVFVAHLGSASAFTPKFRAQVDGHKLLGENLIFLSDGAPWLRYLMAESYPKATLILDRAGGPVLPCNGTPGQSESGCF